MGSGEQEQAGCFPRKQLSPCAGVYAPAWQREGLACRRARMVCQDRTHSKQQGKSRWQGLGCQGCTVCTLLVAGQARAATEAACSRVSSCRRVPTCRQLDCGLPGIPRRAPHLQCSIQRPLACTTRGRQGAGCMHGMAVQAGGACGVPGQAGRRVGRQQEGRHGGQAGGQTCRRHSPRLLCPPTTRRLCPSAAWNCRVSRTGTRRRDPMACSYAAKATAASGLVTGDSSARRLPLSAVGGGSADARGAALPQSEPVLLGAGSAALAGAAPLEGAPPSCCCWRCSCCVTCCLSRICSRGTPASSSLALARIGPPLLLLLLPPLPLPRALPLLWPLLPCADHVPVLLPPALLPRAESRPLLLVLPPVSVLLALPPTVLDPLVCCG